MAKKKQSQQDATAYKKSEYEPLFGLMKDPKTEKVKICVGSYIASASNFDTFESAENYILSKPYELMINVACIFMNEQLKAYQNEKGKENK